MTDVRLAITTTGSKAEADRIATALVEENLAACVQIVPGAESVYRWQGAVHHDQEWLLLIKTIAARLPQIEARVKQLHSYDLPEFLVLAAVGGSAEYLAWVAAQAGRELSGENSAGDALLS